MIIPGITSTDPIDDAILRGLVDRRTEVEGPDFDYADESLIGYARSVRAALEQAGLLMPTPVEVRVEYGAWCHGEDRNGIRLDQDRLASRAQAATWGDGQIGRYGITGYRVMRCEHHIFADGSRYATAITAWVEDAEGEK